MKKSVYIIAAFVVSGFMLQAGQVKAQSTGIKEKEEAQKRAILEEQYLQQEKEVQKAEQKYRQAREIYRIGERGGEFLVAPVPPVGPVFAVCPVAPVSPVRPVKPVGPVFAV